MPRCPQHSNQVSAIVFVCGGIYIYRSGSNFSGGARSRAKREWPMARGPCSSLLCLKHFQAGSGPYLVTMNENERKQKQKQVGLLEALVGTAWGRHLQVCTVQVRAGARRRGSALLTAVGDDEVSGQDVGLERGLVLVDLNLEILSGLRGRLYRPAAKLRRGWGLHTQTA